MSLKTHCRALTKANLRRVWLSSRDSTTRAGRPGVDRITAEQFAARLDHNLESLAKQIRSGQYGPSALRGVSVTKADSDKLRLICIPTIRDRIVQRALVGYLVRNSRLGICTSSSYGFLAGRGVRPAIERALELRLQFDWCVKTDIESFFDSIPRTQLKERISKKLNRCSVQQLVNSFVDCEIKNDPKLRQVIASRGIRRGVGLRQGMPLSPLLSNFVLAPFDFGMEKRKIPMIRYADDILLFFPDKQSAKDGLNFVADALLALGFTIPHLSEHSKTRLVAPREPLIFLGRQLRFVEAEKRYVSEVPRSQMAKIRKQIEDEFNFDTQSSDGKTFQEAILGLSRSISAYLGIYKDAFNYRAFDNEMRGTVRAVMTGFYEDIFGRSAMQMVSDRGRAFLGIKDLDMPDPLNDLEDNGLL